MAVRFFRIHPAIGVGRVGDADRSQADFYFIGPEVPGIPANYDVASQSFKPFKKNGKVRPQAVRFRVFEFERADDGSTRLIGETKLNERGVSAIKWTVHVANRKASFVKFNGQDGATAVPLYSNIAAGKVRNPTIETAATRRAQLDLDPGPKSIAGGDTGKVDLTLASGPQLKKIKTLGELRSDAAGRLIFIGGRGFAEASPPSAPITNYANNDGWFDDVSDGPVAAELMVDGQTVSAVGAWVITGPPDFAPVMRCHRTMFDTLADMMARDDAPGSPFAALPAAMQRLRDIWNARSSVQPKPPSFVADIHPILKSMTRMWRVHARKPIEQDGADQIPYHTTFDDSLFDVLGREGQFDADAADGVFFRIRNPQSTGIASLAEMPYLRGDDPYPAASSTTAFHAVSDIQYAMLKLWTEGKVILDWTGSAPIVDPAAVTPDGLDEAALENCTGGPFFPGMEMGWLTTHALVYAEPLRFAIGRKIGAFRVPGQAAPRDLMIEAGTFSQQMAQPWQADFLDCKREQVDDDHPTDYVGWWPVQRPDDVFIRGSDTYVEWARGIKPGQYTVMAAQWSTRGFVVHIDDNLFEVEGPPALVG